MGLLDIGIKKHQEHRQENLLLLSKVHGDCVTSHGLTAYHLFLGSYFEATLTTGMTGDTDTYDQVLNSSSRDIYLSLSEICQHQQQLEHLSGICFFSRKSSGKQIHAKTIWLKNVLKPTLDMKQQVFPRNKLKIIIIKNNSRSE